MVRKMLAGGIAVAALLASAPGFAGVKVRFVDPEHYADAGARDAGSSQATLAALRRIFDTLGQRYLDPRDDLTIDVLDVDLAGEYEPVGRAVMEMRVLRDTTPPRFRLRYMLSERGKRKESGEDVLSDMNYQMTPHTSTDQYVYEKAMLAGWFRKRFAGTRP